MEKNKYPDGKYMATVKVGPKGQIVIPKEVRDMFGINAGDMLLLLADVDRGVAIHHYDVLKKVMDEAFEKGTKGENGNEGA